MKRDLAAESRKLQSALCGYPGLRHETADKKLTQKLLLDTNGEMMVWGRSYRISTKHIGAGVYRIQLAAKEE
jgi:hypothetical protein